MFKNMLLSCFAMTALSLGIVDASGDDIQEIKKRCCADDCFLVRTEGDTKVYSCRFRDTNYQEYPGMPYIYPAAQIIDFDVKVVENQKPVRRGLHARMIDVLGIIIIDVAKPLVSAMTSPGAFL